MNKPTVVVAILVLIVAAIIFFKPFGEGTPIPLSIVPADDKMSIPTDVACSSVQDCMDYAKTLDPNTQGLEATCAGTCTFIIPKAPLGIDMGVPQ